MTPDSLFEYANQCARLSEQLSSGTKYPTFRQVAKHFNVAYDDIEDAISDYCGDGYLGAIVGMRVGQNLTFSFKFRSQYQVEAYL